MKAIQEGDFTVFQKYYYGYNFEYGCYFPSTANLQYKDTIVGHINILNEIGFNMITKYKCIGDKIDGNR